MKILGEQFLTSSEVGDLLQVNPSSVKKWVDDGLLRGFRTPGGHRRIRAADLVTFLERHGMPIPGVLQDAAKTRILAVDHDAEHLKRITRALKRLADRVELVTASNAVDALVAVGAFHPQAILLDAQLPGLDPIEACGRLSKNPTTRSMSVYLFATSFTAAFENRAREAGATECLEKPVDVRQLLTRIFSSRGLTELDARASSW